MSVSLKVCRHCDNAVCDRAVGRLSTGDWLVLRDPGVLSVPKDLGVCEGCQVGGVQEPPVTP